MIPIASSTTLSIEKTSKLLQNLVNLRNNSNAELPERISTRIDYLLKAQEMLVHEIEEYLCQPTNYENENHMETITTVIQTCPEFLATKDKHGWLPCHQAAHVGSSSANKYLLLFADIGYQHNIGGEKSRGGLLVRDDQQFHSLAFISDPKVFDALKKHDPPLFYIKDVKRNILLHHATRNYSLDLVKYFCSLDPSCIYKKNKGNQ